MADTVRLRFLFANHDGAERVVEAPLTRKVAELKEELLGSWPDDVKGTREIEAIRFICMGRGILQDDQTLAQCNLPNFDPVPVNVSIRPEGLKPIPTKTKRMNAPSARRAARGESDNGNGATAASGEQPDNTSCFCVIL
uniref:UBL3-like ubiquitin domain-containing protein n=1 Tax=Phaeomonas parva TaxID=124430 RepID=A0A7S1UIA8_9STRA|mmetsp:Transcript_7042/g.20552  ORF Transcript_7042/g.20552 Transcript_7042/m.20552 type:complete len:139 (+) Transcript_7042:126-542(+)